MSTRLSIAFVLSSDSSVEDVLYLIEQQQKEIKKQQNKIERLKSIIKTDNIINKERAELIEQQQKEIEILKLTNNYLDIANKDYISKDKLREIFNNYLFTDTEELKEFYQDIFELLEE